MEHPGIFRRNAISRARARPASTSESIQQRIGEGLPSHPEYPYEEYNPFSSESDIKDCSVEEKGFRHFHSAAQPGVSFSVDVDRIPLRRQGSDKPHISLPQAYQSSKHQSSVGTHDLCVPAAADYTRETVKLAERCAQEALAAFHEGQGHAEPSRSQFLQGTGAQFDGDDSLPSQQLGQSRNQYTPSLYSESELIGTDCLANPAGQRVGPYRSACECCRTPRLHEQDSDLDFIRQPPRPLHSPVISLQPPNLQVEKLRSRKTSPPRVGPPSRQLTKFPHPHQFDTSSNRAQFDPLNFFPSAANSHGKLELPGRAPGLRRVTEPAGKPKDDIPQIVVEPSGSHRRSVTQPCIALDNAVVFNGREGSLVLPAEVDAPASHPQHVPTSSVTSKHRKRSIHRLAESFKKLFLPRSTPETPDIRAKHLNSKSGSDRQKPSLPNRFFRRNSQHQQQLLGNARIPRTEQPPLPKMDRSRFLDPSLAMMALTKQKSEAMRLAREQGAAVTEMCRRAKTEVPPYTFEELIGKGSYGRVYKGRQLSSQKLVAIKVMDIDTLDYKAMRDLKDESIKDFIHETKVLQQVKDAGAKNINMLIEAVSIHSQLWLICEYCPGGSVKTLMRATGDKLDEKFIIPIARELAEGLKAIHDAGIIHRDVKAANVLIHEEGRLEICDFGVAGVLQTKLDKRSTWIGTPHWMPPEMFPNRAVEPHQYGSEVDVWAYGCTLFECATGNPPNATLRERMQIGRQLNRFAPKLEGDTYSENLRSLVSYSLTSDPKTRPSMKDILEHEYIVGSSDTHPTAILSELVRIYYQWSQRGGQRISLFNPGGALAAEMPDPASTLENEDWNFSTTAGFEKRHSILDLDELSASLAALDEALTPTAAPRAFGQPSEMTPDEKANFDERVKRGAAAMEGLFNESKPDYKYETKNDFVPVQKQRRSSDLPLRTDTDRSSVTSTFIDINLGDYESAHYAAGSASNNPPFQLADPDTIRANRSSARLFRNSSSSSSASQEFQPRGPRPPTMEWTFESATRITDEPETMTQGNLDDRSASEDGTFKSDKRETMTWTFPIMNADEGAPGDDPVVEDGPIGGEAEEHIDPDTIYPWRADLEGTIRGPNQPFPTLQPPPLGRRRSSRAESPGGSRPSTALSAQSDMDRDPFRFDGASSPSNPGTPHEERHTPTDRFPTMPPSSLYEDYESSTLVGSFNDYPGTSWSRETTLRNGTSTEQRRRSVVSSLYSTDARLGEPVLEADRPSSLYFPEPMPPSSESLTEGGSEDTVSAELDRLLGDLIQGLASTREAFAAADNLGTARGG
ncbi:hypothetical protein D8B26_003952 [Coccidioides posadasii str. Silveira]|uniref:uncharacterized protein n=1 Tax=Coccidioides posadasii (strain RMSCC 757 / Silveira) TaxID=443226 RepID=UPI001BF06450|nr:hypothetical protein D8B26_003952 [Coccidioides posadasii str. Silveira]